jgi:TonB family protein
MNKAVQKIALIVVILVSSIPASAQKLFSPPEILTAGDVQSPINSIASGIVILDVSLNSGGEITKIDIPRPIASLASIAKSAARSWKFKPASSEGAACPGVLRVAFAFRPRAIYVTPPAFVPLSVPEGGSPDKQAGYIPPGITAVAYPTYPINAANVGAVVVHVALDAEGKVSDVAAVRPFNPFTRFALEAARAWSFRPATLDGTPLPSAVVIVFVFTPPNSNE